MLKYNVLQIHNKIEESEGMLVTSLGPTNMCNKTLQYQFAPPRLDVPIKTSRFSKRTKILVLQRRLKRPHANRINSMHESVSRKAVCCAISEARCTTRLAKIHGEKRDNFFRFFFLLFYIVEHLKKNVIWMLHADVWCCGIVYSIYSYNVCSFSTLWPVSVVMLSSPCVFYRLLDNIKNIAIDDGVWYCCINGRTLNTTLNKQSVQDFMSTYGSCTYRIWIVSTKQ